MSTFTFTIKAGTTTYFYEGSLESLHRHLKKNEQFGHKVVESETKFTEG